MRAGRDIRFVRLLLLREELPKASLALARLEAFAPEERQSEPGALRELPAAETLDEFNQARSHCERLLGLFDAELRAQVADATPPPALELEELGFLQLSQTSTWLKQAWSEAAFFETTAHQLEEQQREQHNLRHSLAEFLDLNLGYLELYNRYRFLDLRIGVLPAENLPSLHQALGLSGHLILRAIREADQCRVLIAGPRQARQELDEVLASAGFGALELPESFCTSPQCIQTELEQRRHELKQQDSLLKRAISDWVHKQGQRLLKAQALLDAIEPLMSLGQAAQAKGSLAQVQGWLPKSALPDAKALLAEHLKGPWLLQHRAPLPDEYALVPVPPARHPWLRPFSLLVQQYGIPRFGEFDPTLIFGISFCLMFGMMFGDLGQGALFSLLGLLLRRRLGHFAPPLILAGLCSMAFGLLYGSVFGVEDWLEPLWIAPMSSPTLMLAYALGWGVFFISLGSLIAIGNRLAIGDYRGALLDPGGVLSLLLYLSLISWLGDLMSNGHHNPIALVLVLLSASGVLLQLWFEAKASLGERLLRVVVEAFEILSSYFSNSLSFLRVAAFSLNHVALSLAIFTLADMMSGQGHWLMLVFGNIFVMVLEGAIVTIQILRLEYYEGFSRYFQGNGRVFVPLSYRPRA